MFSSRSCTNTAQKTHSKDTPGCSGKSCHDQHLGASRQARVTSRSRDARGAVWHVPHAACPERREPPKRRERGSQGRRGSGGAAPEERPAAPGPEGLRRGGPVPGAGRGGGGALAPRRRMRRARAVTWLAPGGSARQRREKRKRCGERLACPGGRGAGSSREASGLLSRERRNVRVTAGCGWWGCHSHRVVGSVGLEKTAEIIESSF